MAYTCDVNTLQKNETCLNHTYENNNYSLPIDVKSNDTSEIQFQNQTPESPPHIKKIIRNNTPILKDPYDVPLFVLDSTNDTSVNNYISINK